MKPSARAHMRDSKEWRMFEQLSGDLSERKGEHLEFSFLGRAVGGFRWGFPNIRCTILGVYVGGPLFWETVCIGSRGVIRAVVKESYSARRVPPGTPNLTPSASRALSSHNLKS